MTKPRGIGSILILIIVLLIGVNCPGTRPRRQAQCEDIFRAIRNQSLEDVQRLFHDCTCIDCRQELGYTPLLFAAKENQTEIARFLGDRGADVNILSDIDEPNGESGFSPLLWACWHCNANLAELLIHRGANVNQPGREYDSPLIVAAEKGCLPIVKLLIEKGADVNYVTSNDRVTALSAAVVSGHLSVLEYLADHGGDLGSRGLSGATLLMLASNRHLDEVMYLGAKGPDFNARNDSGDTAIFYATEANTKESSRIIRYLILKGANPNQFNTRGQSPLMYAARSGNVFGAEALLENGAMVDSQDGDGMTSLHFACFNIKPEASPRIAELLIEKGAAINQKNAKGETPLMLASRDSNLGLIRSLLDHSAEIDAQNIDGWSALMYAAFHEQVEVIDTLADRGADIRKINSDGKTATLIAKEYHRKEAYARLKAIESKHETVRNRD